jgi:hypothetical protein
MERWLRITHPTQSPQPTPFIASQNSPAFVLVLDTPSASASSADGSESVGPSGGARRRLRGWDPSTLRSILDLPPRGWAFSPTLGSISRLVRPIFALLNQRRSAKSPLDFGRPFAPAFDRRRGYFRQRGNHGVGRTLTDKLRRDSLRTLGPSPVCSLARISKSSNARGLFLNFETRVAPAQII